ncbi:radical SAM family heme chaperone HemW [Thermosulfurimonas marina]|uniref:radical SAM family heme chaperone HemW n=1 Tax=Thermosulfurimonas marina TaxID=2047767 RepID=UPI00144AABEE|nr:radical SAM family heme chaperone HemW [Thermosulfurimonas marina]
MGATANPEARAGLYIHIPFCRAKCPYCDFYSVTHPLEEDSFLSALLTEAKLWSEFWPRDLPLETLYVGGGTPSLLSPRFYERLLEGLAEALPLAPEELTLEANPEGLGLEYLRALRGIGFNRLSIGAQSFSEKGLSALGRRHGPEDTRQAVEAARRAGFENLSLDLIFGWPGQSLSDLQEDLSAALALSPEHLSCYELTVEKGTPFYRLLQEGRLALPSEDLLVAMHETVPEVLEARGLKRYEISNYAHRGRLCRHNLLYWRLKPYLGLGPAAASFWERKRLRNPEDLEEYLRALREGRLPTVVEEVLEGEEALREALFVGLRLLEGVDLEELSRRFGRDPARLFASEIARLRDLGLVTLEKGRLKLTPKGVLLANQVQLHFL